MHRVLIVDDQRTGRQILEAALSKDSGYQLIRSIDNAALAPLYCMKGNIDLILMDVCTAHGESGLIAAETIKKQYPKIKIIIVTSMPEYSFIKKAKKSNCESFWYKDFSKDDLLDVINRTMQGESVYPDSLPPIRIGEAMSYEFTPRELDVLHELVKGSTYKEIAEELSISENTLKTHIKNILSKTGYKNTLQIAVDVVDKKLILPGY